MGFHFLGFRHGFVPVQSPCHVLRECFGCYHQDKRRLRLD